MVSDSMTTAPIPSAANAKNLGKKKRTNRSAKLKQCKFDARREQWLSQGVVKRIGCKDGQEMDDVQTPPTPEGKDSQRSLGKLEMSPRGEENDGSVQQDSDIESPSNSPTSFNISMLGGNDSGTNFTGSSSSSSSSGSAGCWSGNITEEEEGDDECLDDWEAMADALAADDKHQNQCSESPPALETVVQMVSPCEITNGLNLGVRDSKPESSRLVPKASGNCRAWRPDDAYRPQSLPNLSKQNSFPNPDQRYGGGMHWACIAVPSCPICYEDLDITDSSFSPCLCGFRLCLFCHKRILEEDGRCPGCRKPYESEPM